MNLFLYGFFLYYNKIIFGFRKMYFYEMFKKNINVGYVERNVYNKFVFYFITNLLYG